MLYLFRVMIDEGKTHLKTRQIVSDAVAVEEARATPNVSEVQRCSDDKVIWSRKDEKALGFDI